MVSGFVHLLKLGQTLAFANRTIVSPAINRAVAHSKLDLGPSSVRNQQDTSATRPF